MVKSVSTGIYYPECLLLNLLQLVYIIQSVCGLNLLQLVYIIQSVCC